MIEFIGVVCLFPLILLFVSAFMGQLGANPLESIIRDTGIWTLRFLLFTLSITPLYKLTGWYDLSKQSKLRRTLGLYAFFYGSLHFLSYVWFDQSFDGLEILNDLIEHPSLDVGLIAFILMIPLALTSSSNMMKRLGKSHWRRLHWLIYPSGIAGIVHFWWLAQTKADIREPLFYTIVLALLFILRYPPLINRLRH